MIVLPIWGTLIYWLYLWIRVHTWHKNMHLVQKAIFKTLHTRTSVIQRTGCLYFYDICIFICQSDCKMGMLIEMINMKLFFPPSNSGLNLNAVISQWGFHQGKFVMDLFWLLWRKLKSLDWSELGGKALYCYHCCLWLSDCLLCRGNDLYP